MILHADAVPQNRPARIRTGRIDRNDSHCAILLAVMLCQLIHKRALARARRAGEPQNPRVTSLRKQRFQ